jgi:hypothetical protein
MARSAAADCAINLFERLIHRSGDSASVDQALGWVERELNTIRRGG